MLKPFAALACLAIAVAIPGSASAQEEIPWCRAADCTSGPQLCATITGGINIDGVIIQVTKYCYQS
jgi:hypothetical protein